MKIVVQVRLLPTPDEASVLAATLRAVNAGANVVSAVAFEKGVTSRNDVQKLVYGRLKAEFGLGAQAAVHGEEGRGRLRDAACQCAGGALGPGGVKAPGEGDLEAGGVPGGCGAAVR
ncbi:hypothetical protein [Streptomyces sp. KR80]|uniref:hypothetical protein n=1 Tax=Streptomyces sp. KR80 TaxID=3457426 RepID=UPI003FD3F8BA